MFTHPAPGRRRTLDRNKKRLLCDAVSRGATMTEAALTVGVSLRTVQREARLDPDFDQELRSAHTDKPDPLVLMQSAARTHWRAAAWLLERTKPEDYGRRPASSCSPFQFEEALKVVIDAALRLAPPENRAQVYAELTAASETAFKAIFPNYGPYGRHLVRRLPATPLADEQRLEVLGNPPPHLVVPDPPFEPTAHLQPPALPGDRPHLQDVVTMRNEAPGQRPGLQVSELATSVDRAAAIHQGSEQPLSEITPPSTPSIESRQSCPSAESTTPPPSAPAGRSHVARGASPWIRRQRKSKPQRGDVAPAFPPTRIRSLRPARTIRSFAPRSLTIARLPGPSSVAKNTLCDKTHC